MNEPWTPGPWHEERGMLLSAEGYIVCDPYGPNPQDRRILEAAPEMADLLEVAETLIHGYANPDADPVAKWKREASDLLSRIRGQAEVTA